MKNIKTTIEIELPDVKEFIFYHYRKSTTNKLYNYFLLPIQLPILLLLLMNLTELWLPLGSEIVLILSVKFGLHPFRLNKRSRKDYQTERKWTYPMQIELNEEKYIEKGKYHSSETKLKTFYKFVETKNLIVLYSNEFTGAIIPKRYLNQNELIALRRNLKINVKPVPVNKFKSIGNWFLLGILYTVIIGMIISIFSWNTIAVQYLSYKAFNLHKRHKIDEATVVYKEILKKDSLNEYAKVNLLQIEIEKLSKKAYKFHSNSEFDRARNMYNEILMLDENNTWAKENLKLLPNE